MTQTKRTRQAKPKCTKGTACGYSCINGKLTCSSRILERDAAELVSAATNVRSEARAKAKPEIISEKPLNGFTSGAGQFKTRSVDVPPDTVTTYFFPKQGGKAVEIAFTVNNTVESGDDGANVQPANAVKVAMVAMRTLKSQLADMPDGILFVNEPSNDDGRGADRAKLYTKAGFGPIGNLPGKDTQSMFAMSMGGKLVPVDFEVGSRHYTS